MAVRVLYDEVEISTSMLQLRPRLASALPVLPQKAQDLVAAFRPNHSLTLADRILAERVRMVLLGDDSPEAAGLHAYVFDGAITLYGTIEDEDTKNELAARLNSLPGAKKVVADHIQVKMGPLAFS